MGCPSKRKARRKTQGTAGLLEIHFTERRSNTDTLSCSATYVIVSYKTTVFNLPRIFHKIADNRIYNLNIFI